MSGTRFFPFLILLALGILVASCSKERTASVASGGSSNVAEIGSVTRRGEKVPDFSWKDSTGRTVSFDSFRGRVTLINFWATWCGPCRKELPDLIAISHEFSDRGVKVIGISEDRGSSVLEDVRTFVAEKQIPYQVIISNDDLEESFNNVRMLPTTFVVNDSGAILQTLIGAQSKAVFTQALTAALK